MPWCSYRTEETSRRTEESTLHAQHPAYDIQLAGSGDLVLTDVRATSARVLLDDQIWGRVYVRDGGGRLVLELEKALAQPVELALAPGAYHLAVAAGRRLFRGEFTLADGKSVRLGAAQLSQASPELTEARGQVSDQADPEDATPNAPAGPRREILGYVGLRASAAEVRDQWTSSAFAGPQVRGFGFFHDGVYRYAASLLRRGGLRAQPRQPRRLRRGAPAAR